MWVHLALGLTEESTAMVVMRECTERIGEFRERIGEFRDPLPRER